MDNEQWRFKASDLFTVPNLLTYMRFILVAPFMYYFINQQYIPAAICIGISGLTDCFDGMLARKLNQVTSLGKILDPIADKVTLIAVAVCMLIYMPSILPIMLVLVVKELLMLIGGFVLLIKKIAPPPANIFGKVATLVFYFTICIVIFLKAVFSIEIMSLIVIGSVIVALAMLVALVQYAMIFVKLLKNANKENA